MTSLHTQLLSTTTSIDTVHNNQKVPLEWTTEQATTNNLSHTAILGGVVVLGRRLKLISVHCSCNMMAAADVSLQNTSREPQIFNHVVNK